MKHLRLLILSVLTSLLCCTGPFEADAQVFGISVTNSVAAIPVGGSVTYNFTITNLTGIPVLDTFFTNAFSLPVQVTGFSSTNFPTLAFTNSTATNTTFAFDLRNLPFGDIALVALTVMVNTNGTLTNAISLSVPVVGITNSAVTNLLTQVTNVTYIADLSATITAPSAQVFAGDWMNYRISVTNFGPASVTNVFLTNTFATGVGFIGSSPANVARPAGGILAINLGTLAKGASTNFIFTVQPTNAGTLTLSALVGAANVQDTNTANNLATTNIIVANYLAATLVAVTNSPQTTNRQNGLIEQSILLLNNGTNTVPSARVVVTGLTNFLFNAAGTNNGNPYVVYASALNPGQGVPLLLKFYVPAIRTFPFSNSQLQAVAVSMPDLTPPPFTGSSTNLSIDFFTRLSSGGMLLEFPATAGRTYTIVYSDNALFSNALRVLPLIVAPANYVDWIDYGPPETVSHPTNAPARFYRVYLNP